MWINLGYILSYIRRIKLYSHHHRWSNIISKVPVKRPLHYNFFHLYLHNKKIKLGNITNFYNFGYY
jgi:hypothetical protein